MIGYNVGAEYSGPITNTMPPAPARLYSDAGAVAFRSTDGMDENWRPVVGLGGAYEVSDLGRVRGLARLDVMGRRLHAKILANARMGSTNRYVRIRLRADNRTLDVPVHHMVLEAFVGPRPTGADACHNDGDRWNNRLSNLRWDSHAGNQRDKIAHGTIARGSRNGYASLDERRVRFIKAMLVLGVGPTTLSRAFGVAREHVQSIGRGKAWGWLGAEDPTERDRALAVRLIGVAEERHRAFLASSFALTASATARTQARLEIAERELQAALAVAVTYADLHGGAK